MQLGVAIAEVGQQRGKRDSPFTGERFVDSISWFIAQYVDNNN